MEISNDRGRRIRALATMATLAVLAGIAAGGCARPDASAELVEIHERILRAHFDRDLESWMPLEAETVVVASRGEVFTATAEERRAQREQYFERTRFSVYRDTRPPIVRVSRDGTQGWLLANVEVVAHDPTPGSTDSLHTIWAWVELYERRDGRWLMVGNISNDRPGP